MRVASSEQLDGEVYEFRRVGDAADPSVAVEVCSYSHAVDAHYVDGMFQMVYGVDDARLLFVVS